MKSRTVLMPNRLALRNKAEQFAVSPISLANVAIDLSEG
jgi:hypothetical protein